MRILTYSTLFPNAENPSHGIFVAERLRQVLASGEVTASVLAPVPYFPSTSPRFGRYAEFARVPREESFEGTWVGHPRYPVIPKLGMSAAPTLLALASWRALKRHAEDIGDFDLIDAHYLYPDGVAAVMLGRWLGKPVVLTARGSDVTVISTFRLPRRLLRWALGRAAAVATVSDSLQRGVLALGVPHGKVRTLRNGVNLALFRPLPERDSLRTRLEVTGTCLLSVGRLEDLKGHDLIIEALTRLPGTFQLVIAGVGPRHERLQAQALQLGLGDRVRLVGRRSHAELVELYNAADLLVLASSREGMPNVLLESLACGTPAVATDVGGTGEVLDTPVAGELVRQRDSKAIAAAILRLVERAPSREAVRRHGERFGWEPTVRGQIAMFRHALGE